MTIPTKKLSDLAAEASDLRDEIELLADKQAQLSRRLGKIEREEMVEMMYEAGVSEFVHNGRRFILKLWVGGVWPKKPEEAEAATIYLQRIGADGLLKTFVSAQFGRDQHSEAEEVYEEMKKVCDPKIKSAVHPMTLRSFARKRLEEGTDINLDVLGLRSGHIVNVKQVKK